MKRLSLNVVCELFIIFMIVAFSSCQDETESENVDSISNFSLTLSTTAPEGRSAISMMTREGETIVHGDDNYNENVIKSIDCFFYPTGKTNENAFLIIPITTITDNTGTVTLHLNLSKNQVTQLFGGTNSCDIYVIANNANHDYNGNTDVNSLKQMSVSSDFATTNPQVKFVMDGSSTVTLANDRLSGNVELSRSACKLIFSVDAISNPIEDNNGNKWVPYPNHMSVKLINCLKSGNVDSDCHLYTPQSNDYFDYSTAIEFNPITDDNNTLLRYDAKKPFYSYPLSWTDDINSKQPFFVLILPFKKLNKQGIEEGDPVNYYYMVPANKISNELKRNNCYHVTIKVGIIGMPDDPVTPPEHPSDEVNLDWSCVVNHWGSGEVNVEIFNDKYLVVDKNFVELNNQNSAEVNYISSDDVEILSQVTTYQDVSNKSATTINDNNSSVCTLDKTNNKIIYNKILKNDTQIADKSYDFTSYTTVVTVRHINNSNFMQTIKFVQYPLLYIVAQQNSDGTSSSNKGYVFVNYNGKYNNYGGVSGLSGDNENPNMYVISLSHLSDKSDYIIGDPRSRTAMSNVSSWSSYASPIEGGSNRQLKNYYPTDNSDRTRNMIAPKIRIASSYGKTSTLTYNDAQKRCASYQEDGYPAGRWRLATQAELEYIIKLNSDGKMPLLLSVSYYNDTSYYWSANGYVYHDGNGNVSAVNSFSENDKNYVRCVYDEWYWGSGTINNKSTFTWGDKKIW